MSFSSDTIPSVFAEAQIWRDGGARVGDTLNPSSWAARRGQASGNEVGSRLGKYFPAAAANNVHYLRDSETS